MVWNLALIRKYASFFTNAVLETVHIFFLCHQKGVVIFKGRFTTIMYPVCPPYLNLFSCVFNWVHTVLLSSGFLSINAMSNESHCLGKCFYSLVMWESVPSFICVSQNWYSIFRKFPNLYLINFFWVKSCYIVLVRIFVGSIVHLQHMTLAIN